MSDVSLVYAMSRNHIIGRGGDLPWHLPADLKRFREITFGGVVIMGRKTYESIIARLGYPLPGRTSVVVTRQRLYQAPGCIVMASLDAAVDASNKDDRLVGKEVFIIGGSSLIDEGLALANRIYLTYIDAEVDGDTFVPQIDWVTWKLASREDHPADEKNHYPYRFVVLSRRNQASVKTDTAPQ